MGDLINMFEWAKGQGPEVIKLKPSSDLTPGDIERMTAEAKERKDLAEKQREKHNQGVTNAFGLKRPKKPLPPRV